MAHNEEASFSLAENIKTIYSKKETILIISILKDKEIESILKNFSKISETVIFVSLDKNKRGLSETELYNIGYKYFKKSYAVKTVEKSLILAKKIDKKVIVATGSFYLIGEIKKIINKNNFQIY